MLVTAWKEEHWGEVTCQSTLRVEGLKFFLIICPQYLLMSLFRIFESDSFCFSLSLTFLNEILVDDHWLIKKVVLSRLARDLKKHCALGNKMFQEEQKVCGDRVKTFIIVYKSMSEVKYINWPHQSWNRHTPDLPYCQNTELRMPLSNI